MKPETRTVTQLFELDVRYVVPLYQRPYVWEAARQWEPLWEDVVTLLEHQENGDGRHYSHFLGAIVLDQEAQAPGEIPVFTVIDGQQRLTTLQIVLAAAANVAAELDGENQAEIIRELVRNSPRKVSGTDLYKVWPTNANRGAFQAVMTEGGPLDGREDDPHNRIDEAYAFFEERVREWANGVENGERLLRLKLLRITLCDLLKVVTITLEPDDNAQIIFETLNARGTPLLALDLVKNAVFHEATKQGLDVDMLYYEIWKPQLDDHYWRREIRQGRLQRPRGELFLMHWLAMKLRQVIPATELFSTFRERILSAVPPPRMGELVPELCRDAKTMRGFETQEPGSVEATFFERLEALDTSTVLPLVLFLFREPAISTDRRRRALQILESWLVRRMVLGLATKNYSQLVPMIIGRLAHDLERADELLAEELRTGIGQASRWPTDQDVREFLLTHHLYGWISARRIEMLFRAIEASLHTSKVEAVAVPCGLSVEHVMPRQWDAHWPLAEELDAEAFDAARQDRELRINRLGNLTVTTQPLNAAMSNASWQTKQGELKKWSKLLVNTELIEIYSDCFEESSIDERGAILADRILAIWPGPDSWA